MRRVAGVSKELSRIVHQAERAGFRVVTTRKGHLQFLSPSGEIVVAAGTGGGGRGLRNLRAHLERVQRSS